MNRLKTLHICAAMARCSYKLTQVRLTMWEYKSVTEWHLTQIALVLQKSRCYWWASAIKQMLQVTT